MRIGRIIKLSLSLVLPVGEDERDDRAAEDSSHFSGKVRAGFGQTRSKGFFHNHHLVFAPVAAPVVIDRCICRCIDRLVPYGAMVPVMMVG